MLPHKSIKKLKLGLFNKSWYCWYSTTRRFVVFTRRSAQNWIAPRSDYLGSRTPCSLIARRCHLSNLKYCLLHYDSTAAFSFTAHARLLSLNNSPLNADGVIFFPLYQYCKIPRLNSRKKVKLLKTCSLASLTSSFGWHNSPILMNSLYLTTAEVQDPCVTQVEGGGEGGEGYLLSWLKSTLLPLSWNIS